MKYLKDLNNNGKNTIRIRMMYIYKMKLINLKNGDWMITIIMILHISIQEKLDMIRNPISNNTIKKKTIALRLKKMKRNKIHKKIK